MGISTRQYGAGTSITYRQPWGIHISARVLCSDGKVRTTARIAATADSFFSIPAAVRVQGRTVSGYVTIETAEGFTTETGHDRSVVKFVSYEHGKNAHLLPSVAHRKNGDRHEDTRDHDGHEEGS